MNALFLKKPCGVAEGKRSLKRLSRNARRYNIINTILIGKDLR